MASIWFTEELSDKILKDDEIFNDIHNVVTGKKQLERD